jgi:hypothetical protein
MTEEHSVSSRQSDSDASETMPSSDAHLTGSLGIGSFEQRVRDPSRRGARPGQAHLPLDDRNTLERATLTDSLRIPAGEYTGLSTGSQPGSPPRSRSGRRQPLFSGWWIDLTTGKKTRATREDLREAHRIWSVHADVRQGRL